MKIAVVSSTALLTTPWGSLHHMPLPAPSALAQGLVSSYRLIGRLQQAHQAEGSAEEWQSVMRIITHAAAARARTFGPSVTTMSRPSTMCSKAPLRAR